MTGVAQIEHAQDLDGSADRTRISDLTAIIRRRPGMLLPVGYFLSVAVFARLRASPARARGDYVTWLRERPALPPPPRGPPTGRVGVRSPVRDPCGTCARGPRGTCARGTCARGICARGTCARGTCARRAPPAGRPGPCPAQRVIRPGEVACRAWSPDGRAASAVGARFRCGQRSGRLAGLWPNR